MADEDPVFPADESEKKSIKDRAENGDNEQDDVEPPEPPMEIEGGVQLSLNMGATISNRNARKIESAKLRLLGGARDVDGLLDVDTEYDLIVRVLPDMPHPTAKRDAATRKTKSVDVTQPCQIQHIRQAGASAIGDLFSSLLERDPKAAGALLDSLGKMAKEGLKSVA